MAKSTMYSPRNDRGVCLNIVGEWCSVHVAKAKLAERGRDDTSREKGGY